MMEQSVNGYGRSGKNAKRIQTVTIRKILMGKPQTAQRTGGKEKGNRILKKKQPQKEQLKDKILQIYHKYSGNPV